MSNVIAYYRVSTDRQRRSGLGIEAQRTAVHRFAEAEGLTIISEYVEAETGKGADALARRPQLARRAAVARRSLSRCDRKSEGPAVQPIIDKVWRFCERTETRGRTVTLKVKFQDFQQITRSRSIPRGVESRDELATVAIELLGPLFPTRRGIRLLGVSLSNLNDEVAPNQEQLPLCLPPA
jgi:DNA polymerase IV